MKTFVWFVFGVAGGFVLAHLVDKDPRGHDLLAQVDARIGEFTDRITAAYHEQEARITEPAERRDAAAPGADPAAAPSA
ncbi:hypothetical protein [Microbacterium sp. 10M-3C3]|uniref:hypothetical protein n=1 Tax=Microbacterium sp. 10M-3C3 TaxID=2483401 RepID=UPI000F62CA67|nr:hypothetical protein [Microbacterium sp. 10M-3C3]